MGDQILGLLGDPGEITYAELAASGQGRGQGQARGIGERLRLARTQRGQLEVEAIQTQSLGLLEVRTQEIATVLDQPTRRRSRR